MAHWQIRRADGTVEPCRVIRVEHDGAVTREIFAEPVNVRNGDVLERGDDPWDQETARLCDALMGRGSLKELERALIEAALRKTHWLQIDAAKLLGVTPRVLNYKIHLKGIEPPESEVYARRSWKKRGGEYSG